jgi:hypothetical protein
LQRNSDFQLHWPTVKSTSRKALAGQTGHKNLILINCKELCYEFCVLHYAVHCVVTFCVLCYGVHCVVTFVCYVMEYTVLWLLCATLYRHCVVTFCVLRYGVHCVVTFVCYIMGYTVSKHLLLSKPVCIVMSHIILLVLVLIWHINYLFFL